MSLAVVASRDEEAISAAETMDFPVIIAFLECIEAQLPILAAFVEERLVAMVDEFKNLALQVSDNSEKMRQMINNARSVEIDGKEVAYEASIEMLYEPMSDAISKILNVSKLAMAMVMNIGNAADNISRVESCIDQVQGLTKQTNMLAMNTQIEAARTGEAGRSFRIIAQEVKVLSESIKHASVNIQKEVSFVATAVRKSSELVDKLAHYDMTENLSLKEKIDALINNMMAQNADFAELLENSAASAQRISDSIRSLIIGIQFQDRNTQMLGDYQVLLRNVIKSLKWHQARQIATSSVFAEADQQIEAGLQGSRLSEVRRQVLTSMRNKQLLASASPLAGELLAGSLSNKPSTVFSSTNSDDNDDDDGVELF